jgi:hypothetical protein
VVVAKEGFQGRAPREWHRLQRWPAAQKVTEEARVFVLKPLQRLRDIVLQGTGEAMSHPHLIPDQAATVFDELFEGAYGRTLRLERLQLVAMGKEQFELEFGIRGGVCGSARCQGFTVPRQRQRIDREEDKKVVLAQGGDNGTFGEFEANGNGLTAEPRAQCGDPRINGLGRVIELKALPCCGARGLETNIMFGIGPVDPNKGRKCIVWRLCHASSPRVG